MVNDIDTAVTPRPWWDRALDPIVDFVEDRILDPIDLVVTPRVERYQAQTTHRLVSAARRNAEIRAVRSWTYWHATRARLLHAWAGLESSAAHTRRGLHEHHSGTPDGSNGCCAPLVRLYTDRAELLRALAVFEEQTWPLPGRSPNFSAMPSRIRRIAGDEFTTMASTYVSTERANLAEQILDRLHPHIGAAVEPLRRVYIS